MKEVLPDELDELLNEAFEGGAQGRAGASSGAVELAIEALAEKFQISLPLDYASFLRKCNGINWEDVLLAHILDPASDDPELHTFSKHDLISLNEHYRRIGLPKHYLIFGFDDFGIYVHNPQRDTYHLLETTDFSFLRTYETFIELLDELIEGPV
ncbi:MAG: SMI1/KNR4 family protein [Verrucomicrobiota bacterium]